MSPLPGIYASQISGHLSGPTGAYDALALTTLSTSASSVTFSGIPQGYKELIISSSARSDYATGSGDIDLVMTFNGDTTANYSVHYLYGGGGAGQAYSVSIANNNYAIPGCMSRATAPTYVYGSGICSIIDYANPNKYKTVRSLHGIDIYAASSAVYQTSSNWRNSAPITSLNIAAYSSNFVANTTFAIYGVK